ncbi:MAG: response regulator [Clostridiales bacterium]|nr:response regulator [Clostridiales bacterium]
MKKLRKRILCVIMLLVLGGTCLLFLFSYRNARDSMISQAEKNYSVAAEKYAQELSAWINANAAVIDSMAAEITVNKGYTQEPEAFHRYLAESFRQLNRNGVIYDIYFTYPDSRMVCASDFIADGSVDYAHEREWFTSAAGTGELFYSTPYRDSDSGKPIITISRGVYADNVLQGVLAGDIFVDMLVDIISGADAGEDSYAFLVDQNLGMIVHPSDAYDFDDVPKGVMDVPDAPYAEVISKVRSGSGETVYLKDYDGITRGIVVSRMSNTGWYVGIATKKAELTQGLNSLIRSFLIAAAIVLVIGGAAAVLLARAISRQPEGEPLQKKKEAAAEPQKKPESRGNPEDGSAPGRIRRIAPVVLIILLLGCMVLYTTRVITDVSTKNIHEVGEDRISAAAAELDNYLGTVKSTLWVTADTVDHMVQSGASIGDVLNYITAETENQQLHFDINNNGIYGYVKGEYIDGSAWMPPENYDPARRDWYRAATAAGGEAVLVPPYVDAQTGAVILSVSRTLSDGTSVISVDVLMNHIQEIAAGMQIKEKGYGFIMDKDGRLIAHRDEEKQGRFLTEEEDKLALFDRIREVRNGNFEITADRRKSTVFVRQITDQWYAVIVISNAELMAEVNEQLMINVLICTAIVAMIAFFYMISRRTEKNYSRRIEEMRAEEQKQAYEARALKLEMEAADQANQAKSDFLAEMSHEIRTPINAVLGMNEMIIRESEQARTETSPDRTAAAFNNISIYAGNIESAGSNLLSIINDILDFSKIEAGRMNIAEAGYLLSSVLNDVSNIVYFRAKEKGLDFQVEVDESIPDGLYGDEVRIRQVITNLLGNAVKYTRRGGVMLKVSGEAEAVEPGKTITLTVSVQDTGIGIREEDIGKLFTKFQRVDMKRNSTVEGTGLGLAITHSLLSMMGGEIRVESRYGVGSTFTVTLPQKIVSCKPVGNFQMKFEKNVLGAKTYQETFRAPEAHILIVDDTRMNLTVATGLLKSTEIVIDTAVSGAEAIEYTRAVPYDLILMDQRMPKMDGTEALHRIREQQEGLNRETPVICLTADAVIGAKERYLSEGFTDYLTKPIDSKALEKLLIRYLPADKVTMIRKEEALEDHGGKKDEPSPYASLKAAGIQAKIGLSYCQGDDAFYRSLLREYALGAREKAPDMQRSFREKSWKDYAILVHALKSSSRTIGAVSLSETAAQLETAANQEDEAAIQNRHLCMMSQYDAAVQAIRAVIPMEDTPPDAEGDILEFLPEE